VSSLRNGEAGVPRRTRPAPPETTRRLVRDDGEIARLAISTSRARSLLETNDPVGLLGLTTTIARARGVVSSVSTSASSSIASARVAQRVARGGDGLETCQELEERIGRARHEDRIAGIAEQLEDPRIGLARARCQEETIGLAKRPRRMYQSLMASRASRALGGRDRSDAAPAPPARARSPSMGRESGARRDSSRSDRETVDAGGPAERSTAAVRRLWARLHPCGSRTRRKR
jgi:hypothetical protein